MEQKQKMKIITAAVIIFLITFGVIWVLLRHAKQIEQTSLTTTVQNDLVLPESEVQQQLRKLDELQKQQNIEKPSEQQIKEQLVKLDALQKEQKVLPPTQAEIQAQLKQLETLQQENQK